MPGYFGKLFSFFDTRTRWQIAGLLVLMLFGSVLEMLSLAMFFPFFQLAMDPSRMDTIPLMPEITGLLGQGGTNRMIVFFSVALLVIYTLKNTALAGLVLLQNHFVFLKQALFTNSLLKAYMRRPYAANLRQNSAEITRNIVMSSSLMFGNGLLGLLTLVMEGLLVLAVAGLLIAVEPRGALLAGLLLGATMGFLYWRTRNRVETWGASLESINAQLIQVANEGLDAFKEIKIMGRESDVIDQFSIPNMNSVGYRTRLSMVVQLPRLVGEVAILASIFAVVALITLSGDRSIAEVIPVLAIFAAGTMRILPSANRIVVAANHMRQTVAVVNNLYRDFHGTLREEMPPKKQPKLDFIREIRLQDVTFEYETAAAPSLDRVNLTIRKGESVAFVGASGAGKTTLADLILGLHEPQSGLMTVDGRNVQENLRGWQNHLGYVPQQIILSDTSLRRNIAFCIPDDEIDDGRIKAACSAAQLTEMIDSLPDGLDTITGEHGTRISGGQRQRVGIARALYHAPDILVLDEATSALDSETEREFINAIEFLHGQKTIIIIAHRLSTVRDCDRLYLLDHGRIVDSGTFDKLMATNTHFQNMTRLDPPGNKSLPDNFRPTN